MVQFIFTPWRDRAELLRVRSQFYPSSSSSSSSTTSTTTTTTAKVSVVGGSVCSSSTARDRDLGRPWSTPEELRDIEAAIARVFMWVHRGHCPHVVESTALLMAAIVFDEKGGHGAVEGAAVRAGYLMGFTR